jgi:hypothetical protein
MKKFLSPSTRLELLRFMNWEELLAEVAEGADEGVTGAAIVRTANRPDLKFDIVAVQSSPLRRHTMTAQARSAPPSAA